MIHREALSSPHHTVIKTLLAICGIWPYQKKPLKIALRIFASVSILSLEIPLIIRMFKEYYKENSDWVIIIENFSGILFLHTTWAKFAMKIFSEKKYLEIYECMHEHYNDLSDQEEKKILDQCWKISWFFAYFFLVYSATSVTSFVYAPSLIYKSLDVLIPLNGSRPRLFCIYAEYFIDQNKYYHLLMLHVYFSAMTSILVTNAFDSTFVSIAWHIIGLVKILNHRMHKLKQLTGNSDFENLKFSDDQISSHIIVTIKMYNKAIKFFDLVNETYSQCFFFVYLLLLTYLSTGTINVLMNIHNPPVLIKILSFWCGAISYMFFVNWPGQVLLDRSYDLRDSVFFCGWYNFPLKTRFLIRFMILRLTKSCQLMAGPLIPMNLRTCGNLLKLALQYFAVVISINM